MRRRAFITSCISGTVGATVVSAQPQRSDNSAKAIAALRAAKQLEANGKFDDLRKAFHSDALLVEPNALDPLVGRAAIVDWMKERAKDLKSLYFYYRQPQTRVAGSAALIISNYEAGYEIGGQTVEDSGKAVNVVLIGPGSPLIALEVLVPNLYAGSYGALGTALARPRFGIFPVKALGPAPTASAKTAGGGEADMLYKQVLTINDAWVAGKPDDLLTLADRAGVFLIGDYSPYYVTGSEDIKQHFADFYKTSKVNVLHSLDPIVRIWDTTSAVAFKFDLDYTINGKTRRSPGRAVYAFTRRAMPGGAWGMSACAATHLVSRTIGDPYPLPAA